MGKDCQSPGPVDLHYTAVSHIPKSMDIVKALAAGGTAYGVQQIKEFSRLFITLFLIEGIKQRVKCLEAVRRHLCHVSKCYSCQDFLSGFASQILFGGFQFPAPKLQPLQGADDFVVLCDFCS